MIFGFFLLECLLARSVSAMLHVFTMRAEEIAQIPANMLELIVL
jgi:hypothetical protein